MIDWLKIEFNTPDKPEVFALAAKMLWSDPDMAVGKLIRLWRWFDQHTQNGNAVGVTDVTVFDRICGSTGFGQALIDVGWLQMTTEGATLPNFSRHNGKTAKQRALTARRVDVLRHDRYKSNAPGNGAIVTDALASKEVEKRKEGATNGTPEGLNELQYAVRLMEEIRMPNTPQNLRQVAAGIKSEESRGGLAKAYEFVLSQAQEEIKVKGNVTGFWFQDATWRKKKTPENNGILSVNGADKRREAVKRLGGK